MPSHDLLREVTSSPSSLISARQLEALLGEPSVKLFDVRGTWATPECTQPEDYDAGHIPGAVFLDWTRHFLEQDVALRLASVADRAGAARAFKALGIDDGDLVVLYDDYHHMQAGRLWWAMRLWGFADVRVLNGGWSYWTACGLPVSDVRPEVRPGSFEPSEQEGMRVSLQAFLRTQDQSCVIDARAAENYAGTAGDPRTGHIPGSLSLPFRAVLDPETGLFLDPDALARVFDDTVPQWRETPIITSCGAGYAATVILLALSELGRSAGLFDGSFAVWKQDPNRPVAQSALP